MGLGRRPVFHRSIVAFGVALGGTTTSRSCSQTMSCQVCEVRRSVWATPAEVLAGWHWVAFAGLMLSRVLELATEPTDPGS